MEFLNAELAAIQRRAEKRYQKPIRIKDPQKHAKKW
jgi:hypothetical protein